jgi:hypothetical protein
VRMKLNHHFGSKKHMIARPAEMRRPSSVEEIVEDFKNPVPFAVSNPIKGIQKETRVVHLLDEQGEEVLFRTLRLCSRIIFGWA